MSSLDRRSFLQATAAAGLASLSQAQAVAAPPDDDPLGVRADFPITDSVCYLNTAFMGPLPRVVRDAGVEYLDEKMMGRRADRKGRARARFAELFHTDEDEVAFLYSTSEGENVVANGLDFRPGDNVLVDELHFTSSFILYQRLEREKGIELRVVPQKIGRTPVDSFAALMDSRTRLISVAWVSNRNGYRHDLKALAELAHGNGALLYADAIQALGTFPTDLQAEGVDFLCSGTFKWLLAGFGVAPFFIRKEHLARLSPDRSGHAQVEEAHPDYRYRLHQNARKFEYAALSNGSVYQLDAALGYLKRVGLSRIEKHTHALASELRDSIVNLGFQILTPPDNPSPIVSFLHGRDAEPLGRLLEKEGVVVSFRDDGTQIRAAVSLFNNRADIQRFLKVLARVA